MNETKKEKKKNHYKKCSHYIIGASFDSSICFHYFVLLWYVYDLVFWENTMLRRIHRVRAEARAGEGDGLGLSGKQRNLAISTHTPIIYSWLYVVYELACAYSTQAFVFLSFFVLFLKRFSNSNLFEAPAPEPLRLIQDWEAKLLLELQLPLSFFFFFRFSFFFF